MTPSARSTQYLRKLGFIVASVEKVIHMPTAPFPFKRDAFGFGDLLIAKPGFGAALVQVTDSTSVSHRVNKICGIAKDQTDEKQVKEARQAYENAKVWLAAGNRIFVHGWGKRGARGERKTWTLIEREITTTDRQIDEIIHEFVETEMIAAAVQDTKRVKELFSPKSA